MIKIPADKTNCPTTDGNHTSLWIFLVFSSVLFMHLFSLGSLLIISFPRRMTLQINTKEPDLFIMCWPLLWIWRDMGGGWLYKSSTEIIIGVCMANKRRRYNLTWSLLDWVHAGTEWSLHRWFKNIYASVNWPIIISGGGLSHHRRQAITWTDME